MNNWGMGNILLPLLTSDGSEMGEGTDELPPYIATDLNTGEPTENPGPGQEVCDDCRKAYDGPVYYTFEMEACKVSIGPTFYQQHVACTGNLCPGCSDVLMPDDENDPRRPEVEFESG